LGLIPYAGICREFLSKWREKTSDTIAIRCYDETIRIRRRYPKALYNKAVALAESGRHEEAVRF